MILWIDAATLGEAQSLFNLDPLERIARSLRRLRNRPRRIVVSGPSQPDRLPPEFTFTQETGDSAARLRETLKTAQDEPVLALDAAAVADPRLLRHLADDDREPQAPRIALGGEGEAHAGLLRLTADDAALLPESAETVASAARAAAEAQPSAVVPDDVIPSFLPTLRRNLPFYLFLVRDAAAARRIERQLFSWNYKGSTDFVTKWIYPPLVWPLVKLCAALGLSANAVTAVSIVLTFAAIPFFTAGAFATGLACAYAMSVLDSVDGKLARLTLDDSPLGNVLDHGLDIIHPPLWYGAWSWGLGARGWDDPMAVAAILLIAFYIGDRLVLMVAKARFERGLHAMHPLDAAARTWIARRNVNLVIFTAALLAGQGEAGFVFICAWQGLTMAWHAWRTTWLIATRAAPMKAAG